MLKQMQEQQKTFVVEDLGIDHVITGGSSNGSGACDLNMIGHSVRCLEL